MRESTHTGKRNETQRVMTEQLRLCYEQHLPGLISAAILDSTACEMFVKGITVYCGNATNTNVTRIYIYNINTAKMY